MNFMKWKFPAIAWTFILLFLTWYPKLKVPDARFDASDKIAHVMVFVLWGILMCRAASKYEIKRTSYAVRVTIITGTLFAIIDESVQHLIPGRIFSMYDGLANIIGVWLSILVFVYLLQPMKNRLAQKQVRQ